MRLYEMLVVTTTEKENEAFAVLGFLQGATAFRFRVDVGSPCRVVLDPVGFADLLIWKEGADERIRELVRGFLLAPRRSKDQIENVLDIPAGKRE